MPWPSALHPTSLLPHNFQHLCGRHHTCHITSCVGSLAAHTIPLHVVILRTHTENLLPPPVAFRFLRCMQVECLPLLQTPHVDLVPSCCCYTDCTQKLGFHHAGQMSHRHCCRHLPTLSCWRHRVSVTTLLAASPLVSPFRHTPPQSRRRQHYLNSRMVHRVLHSHVAPPSPYRLYALVRYA